MSLSGGNDENTLLLLHGEDLADSSPYGVSITNNGVSISNAQSKFGGKSMYFNGRSSLTLLDKSLVPSSGDFTFDWWEYRTTVGSEGAVFHQNYGEKTGYGFLIGYILSGALDLFISSAGSSWDVASSISMGTILTNQWVHRAIVRNGSKFSIYQNGSLISSFTSAKTITANMYPTLGSYEFSTNTYFSGYIDEFRISDIARWTSNFTPPTEPYSVPIPPTPSNFRLSSSTETAATLAWSAVDGATGYKLYRDGILIATLTDTSYTDTIQPFVSYAYSLTAYNDDGESDPASISVQIIIPPETPSNFRASSASVTAISLAWDAVTGADGYQLKRNGSIIYSGDGTSYTDSGLTAETAYTYTLYAVNSAGSSAETTLEAATTQLILVTDRTAADVDAGNDKGTYKASDLNRVGAAMNYVADRLKAQGYDPHISPKTDWKDGEWVTPPDQAVYLGDLAELRKQFAMLYSTPEVPPRILATGINTNDGLTHTWANDIEKILEDIDLLLTNAAQAWFYSGDLFSGEV